MSLHQILAISLLVPILVQWILNNSSKDCEATVDIVHMPKALLILGICGSIICVILVVFSSIIPLNIVGDTIIISIFLLALLSFLVYYSVHIRYDNQYIHVRKYFKKKTYQYTDIKGIIPSVNNGYTLVMTTGKVHIDGLAVNAQQFLYYAEERCSEVGLGIVPDIPNKLFNGYVLDPFPKALLMCLPGVGLIIISVMASMEFISITIPESLKENVLVIESMEEKNSILFLKSEDRTYAIFSDAIIDANELQSAVSRKQKIKISYFQDAQSDEHNLEIWSIKGENSLFATYETVYKAEIGHARKTVFLLWLAALIYWGIIIGCFYILSHAEKYPKFAALLIRKEHRNF